MVHKRSRNRVLKDTHAIPINLYALHDDLERSFDAVPLKPDAELNPAILMMDIECFEMFKVLCGRSDLMQKRFCAKNHNKFKIKDAAVLKSYKYIFMQRVWNID
eukprot:TRINITY_DN976_c0_g1_i1.p1 TRINITY_DN976_c0_g1~~TRINITY_DN976_c0_g1_i1.p1  ORF type:complete len:104 (-),score=11.77 TRINITY_DN976_c0_g1_i1:394-705(-)